MEATYSQPKLELYGLFRALRHFHLYIIGAKNLIVEVDAKYIKGMLNEPELQPNAVINRWIQGILLFDFRLVHIPATKFKGPDALSRRPLEDDIEVGPYDDTWLDEIALFHSDYGPCLRQNNGLQDATLNSPDAYALTVVATQETTLRKIYEYLTNPVPETVTCNFLKRVAKYYAKAGRLFKRTKSGHPLLVIFDTDKRQELLNMAHESLGHHGEKTTWENLRTRFYWPQMCKSFINGVKLILRLRGLEEVL